MADKKLGIQLNVKDDSGERTLRFEQGSVTIGCGKSSELKLSGKDISDVHVMLDSSRGDVFSLMDLGSEKGTFVNDEKTSKYDLKKGDTIRIGSATIEVVNVGYDLQEEQSEPEPADEEKPEAAASEETAKEDTKPSEPEPPMKKKDEKKKEQKVEEKKDASKETKEAVEAKSEKSSEKEEKDAEDAKEEKGASKEATGDDLLEKKKLAFEKAKAEARKRKRQSRYTMELIPEKVERSTSKQQVFEVREILWNNMLMDMLHYSKAPSILVGERGADFFVRQDHLPDDDKPFELFAGNGKSATLNFTKSMKGRYQEGDDSYSFEELVSKNKAQKKSSNSYSIDVAPGSAVTVDFDEVQYYVRWVPPAGYKKAPFTKDLEYPIVGLFGLLYTLFVLFYIQLTTMPPPEIADILDAPERIAKFILEPMDDEDDIEEPEEEKLDIRIPKIRPWVMKEKIGEEEAVVDKTEGDARKRLEEDRVVDGAGILGALDTGMEAMDRLFGGGGLGAGLDKTLGMLEGISGLDMRGVGGLGMMGAGMGGGGAALGIGGLGTRGRGGGRGGAARYGIGASGKLKKRKGNINIRTGSPTIQGSLDKSIIARIIQKHRSQIRYCYQKELQRSRACTVRSKSNSRSVRVATCCPRWFRLRPCATRVSKAA